MPPKRKKLFEEEPNRDPKQRRLFSWADPEQRIYYYNSNNRENPYYETWEELVAGHSDIFSPDASLTLLERPIEDRNTGLAEATLRLPYDHPNYREELLRAFAELFRRYPQRGVEFEVVATANLALQGTADPTFRVWYGQDYSDKPSRQNFGADPQAVQIVKFLSQVSLLRTSFTQAEFEGVFFGNFDESDVHVFSIINTVYIIRLHMSDFARMRTLPTKQRYKTLW